jgi:hypothetical protein
MRSILFKLIYNTLTHTSPLHVAAAVVRQQQTPEDF